MRYRKCKGYVLSEVVAAITCIAILTQITTWYTSAKAIQTQAKEGYDFATTVTDRVIEYYEDNSSYPTSGTYDYGTNPGEYIASVNYYAPTSTTAGYIIATFRSDSDGPQIVLRDKWVIKKLSQSGSSHIVSNCYTNVNASFMTGTVLPDGNDSEMVAHSCEVDTRPISDVIATN